MKKNKDLPSMGERKVRSGLIMLLESLPGLLLTASLPDNPARLARLEIPLLR